MATQKRFAQLKIGEQFIYKGKTYQKVKEKRASCCKILYNAKLVEDDKVTVVVPPHIMVQIVTNED